VPLIVKPEAVVYGMHVLAMLTARKEDTLWFKLNLGAGILGAATFPDQIDSFRGVQLGEIVVCRVISWNIKRSLFFLQRQEHVLQSRLRRGERCRELLANFHTPEARRRWKRGLV
jgi:hypothetical protein